MRPFDRLVSAIAPLCAYHDIFVQTGSSSVVPPCPHDGFVPLDEMQRRLADADLVITHAGGTVRLVQRLSGVPIVVPRRRELGECASSRQVDYLRAEERVGLVRAVWEVAALAAELAAAVASHGEEAGRLRSARVVPPAVSDAELIATMDRVCGGLG
ncbi:hypothetical protein Ari01nite_25230 [Paractinoplanes rishiriensis]|uniref:Glycosyl transferase family 28 C-terminal domain-containing protein n=2 Tax=Paractinoplanes rishiriensis TaxID=1050105 RepID=A0A919JXT3_9ACTN|nr:hypothetical protein Ari01nite_25230 [Actinoplanes rishiriensis]